MTNIIWADTMIKGMKKFDELVNLLPSESIYRLRKDRNGAVAELTDGTVYRLVHATEANRGYKCDVAFVDKNIRENIMNCIVYPSVLAFGLPTDSKVQYF